MFTRVLWPHKGQREIWVIENCITGLPRWPSSEESTCQCSRHKFDPWSGEIPHAMHHGSWAYGGEPGGSDVQLLGPSSCKY